MKRNAKRGSGLEIHKNPQIVNWYEILNQEGENLQASKETKEQAEEKEEGKDKEYVLGRPKNPIGEENMDMQVEETKDIQLGELNLDEIKKACTKLEREYIPSQ